MGSDNTIIFDGDFIDADKPVVSAESRGLMYGDGCFETLRSYSGKFLHLEKHLERFRAGAEFLGIKYPSFFEAEKVKKHIKELLYKNGLEESESVIRLQLWREGKRGYGVEHSQEGHFSVILSKLPVLKKHIYLAVAKTRRIPRLSLPSRFKLTNNINYILARKEAENENADDALMLTTDEFISETTIANIFWAKNDTVYTPSEECDILPGITRKIIISLCKQSLNHEVQEGGYLLSELDNADAVWTCNSIREIIPVSMIGSTKYNVEHFLIKDIAESFKNYRSKQLI